MEIRNSTEQDFKRIMEIYAFAREYMKSHGDNIVMQNLLKKLGFNHSGTIYVEEDDYPRLAFEKTK